MTEPAVIIVQPNMKGHRFNYCRLLISHINSTNGRTLLATTPDGRDQLLNNAPELSELVEFIHIGADPSLSEISGLSSKHPSVSLVLIPDGDRYVRDLLRFRVWGGKATLRLLVMRRYAQSGPFKRLQTAIRHVAYVLASRFPRIDVVLLASSSHHAPTQRAIDRVPDPIELSPSAPIIQSLRESQGISPSVYWCLICGSLDTRKNIPLVFGALKLAAKESSRGLGLILAGSQTAPVRQFLDSQSDDLGFIVIEDDRHLPEVVLDSYISMSDAVIIAHSNEGPSGIMGKASAAGTTIIAAGAQALKEDCATLATPTEWVRLDPFELGHAVIRATRRSTTQRGLTTYSSVEPFCRRLLEEVGQ